MTKRKIKVFFCDEKRNHSSELLPYYESHATSNKIRNKMAWDETTKQLIWTEIITEIIRKQKEVLEYLHKKGSALLEEYVSEMHLNDESNREGHTAKVYFNAIFGMSFTRGADNFIKCSIELWIW